MGTLNLPLLPNANHSRQIRNYYRNESKTGERIRNYNTYSVEDKASALVVINLIGVRRAERFLTIPEQTLSDWKLGKHGITHEVLEMARYFSDQIARGLDEILEAALPEALKRIKEGKTSYKDLMIGMGIAYDKSALLKGLPTEIVDGSASIEERQARLKDLLDKAIERAKDDDGAC